MSTYRCMQQGFTASGGRVRQQDRAGMGSWSGLSAPGIVGAAGDLQCVNRGAHLEDIVVETSDFVFVGVDTRQHVAQGGLQTLHRRLRLCAVAEVDERASLGLSSQSFFICILLFGPKRPIWHTCARRPHRTAPPDFSSRFL